ncbi:MAG: hypothetical protein LBF22_08340 [Deltaproteobacteria bacterium]|jgi:hypothetical protein|nr:hypothetical protein [Deltaproteobacteria bacterium]
MFKHPKKLLGLISLLFLATLMVHGCGKDPGEDAWQSFQSFMNSPLCGEGNWSSSGHSYDLATQTLTVTGLEFNINPAFAQKSDQAHLLTFSKVTVATLNITEILSSKKMDNLLKTTAFFGKNVNLAKSLVFQGIQATVTDQTLTNLTLSWEKLAISAPKLTGTEAQGQEGSASFLRNLNLADIQLTNFKISGLLGPQAQALELAIESYQAENIAYNGPSGESGNIVDILLGQSIASQNTKNLSFLLSATDGEPFHVIVTIAQMIGQNIQGITNIGSSELTDISIQASFYDIRESAISSGTIAKTTIKNVDFSELFAIFKNSLETTGDYSELLSALSSLGSLCVYPYSVDSWRIEDINVDLENGVNISVASMELQGPIQAYTLSNYTSSIKQASIIVPNESIDPILQKKFQTFQRLFGEKGLTFGIDYKVDHDQSTNLSTYNLKYVAPSDNSELSLVLKLSNISPELIELLGKITFNEVEQLLLYPAGRKFGINEVNLNFTGQTLLDNLFNEIALNAEATRAEINAGFVQFFQEGTFLSNARMELTTKSSTDLAERATSLSASPQSFGIIITPSPVLSLENIQTSRFSAEALFNSLNITFAANSLPPAPILVVTTGDDVALPMEEDVMIEEEDLP